ncbi:MAG: lanthionine synthetase LanC family protein, partial [Chitinophagaceae bacterium]
MLLVKEKKETQLLELAKEYGNILLQERSGENGLLGWKTGGKINPELLNWNNPENIDSGVSGLLLFLLELYKQTKEENYLAAVDQSIAGLVEYCKNTPTDNYGLYTGRSGVIYLLLQRYILNGDDQLIAACLELSKAADHRFLHSKYTTDYLYDGRAGALLTILHLYLISKEPFLLKYIYQYLGFIMNNAKPGRQGIYWMNDEEFNIKPSCGFAHGSAGIRYVLQQVNRCVSNPALEMLIDGAGKHANSCWVENFSNWGNFENPIVSHHALEMYKTRYAANDARIFEPVNEYSWACGAAGMLLSLHDEQAAERINEVSAKITDPDAYRSIASVSLYDGLAGLGMFYLSSEEYESNVKELVDAFTEKNFRLAEKMDTDGGLMHGNAGVFYFLLKASEENGVQENVLLPFANISFDDSIFLKLSLNPSQ